MSKDKTVEIEITAKDSTGAGVKSAEKSMDRLKKSARDFQKGIMALVALDQVFGQMSAGVQKVSNVAKSLVAGFQAFGPAGAIVTGSLAAINAVGEAFVERATKARDAVLAWADALSSRLALIRSSAFDDLVQSLASVEQSTAAAAASFERLAAARERAAARREAAWTAAGDASMLDMRRKASEAVFNADDADRARVQAEWAVKLAGKEAAQKALAADRAATAEDARLKLLEERVRLEEKAARAAGRSVERAEKALQVARETAEVAGKRGWEIDQDQDVQRYRRVVEAARDRSRAAALRVEGAQGALDEARDARSAAALSRKNAVAEAFEAQRAAERNLADIVRRERLAAAQAEERERLAAVQTEEAARLAAERRILRERTALGQKELQERIAEEQNAAALVHEAQARLNQAWNWYKDKDAMAAQLEAEKEDAKAQVQFEKDFDHLRRFHRDWRTADNLGVEDEAVRRVAIAREQRDAAEKFAAETARNTARAADALEAVKAVFENGGE